MSKDTAVIIGGMIRKARLNKGLTQKELAKRVGSKQPSISRVENGKLLPTLTFLTKVADALETKLQLPTLE